MMRKACQNVSLQIIITEAPIKPSHSENKMTSAMGEIEWRVIRVTDARRVHAEWIH